GRAAFRELERGQGVSVVRPNFQGGDRVADGPRIVAEVEPRLGAAAQGRLVLGVPLQGRVEGRLRLSGRTRGVQRLAEAGVERRGIGGGGVALRVLKEILHREYFLDDRIGELDEVRLIAGAGAG